ncbi:PDZ domain-containing protein [Colwellia psychrerythraea]|uniref:PDZ/DHR/GLGF domain protein n=1 Tax=Colwellia psychrerythraea TaxID=28229 RepID=A0A099KQA8_COLPS|nr:PDZ domain-containing protein [Colwellia psychrerythraea]KGJ92072.1 PDZ/DHR/GLGF domain protein [Colwellia psychrerythraea]
MNLVSKTFNLMNVTKLSLLVLALTSLHVSAEQCATISFNKAEKNNQAYVTVVVAHNGEGLERTKGKSAIIAGEHNYYFATGKHTIMVEQWPVRSYKKLRRTARGFKKFNRSNLIPSKYKPADIFLKTIQLNVKANQHYQLEYFQTNEQAAEIRVKSEYQAVCAADDASIFFAEKVFVAKKVNSNDTTINDLSLPDSLEYRLRKLMTKIGTFHQNTEVSTTYTNVFYAKLNDIIGTAINNEYVDNGTALLVLSVLPNSFAQQLKLRSGDKITHLSGVKVKADERAPDQQFSHYMSSLYLGEKVKINVVRNNKKLKLTGEYKPVILPEVSYQLPTSDTKESKQPALITHKTLPGIITFELDQLLLEVVDFYKSNNYKKPNIHLTRNEVFDRKLGFSGKKVARIGRLGFELEQVDEESFAQSIGLIEGDIIVEVNDNSISHENFNTMVKSLTSLTSGQKLSLTIQRDKQNLTLSKQYQPEKLIAFDLTLDLYSLALANAKLEEIASANRVAHRKGELRFDSNAYDRASPSAATQNMRALRAEPKIPTTSKRN